MPQSAFLLGERGHPGFAGEGGGNNSHPIHTSGGELQGMDGGRGKEGVAPLRILGKCHRITKKKREFAFLGGGIEG